ncbi:MAG: hypothetical protein K2Q01_00200, partial [Rickettsiales bacterium]|nr:hypothetical protein [Rickettsiales bacterium]
LPREKRKKYLDDLASIKERKRALEAAMLQMVHMREVYANTSSGSANALVQTGALSAKDMEGVTATVKTSQALLATKQSTALDALAEGLKHMETKRTLQ